MKKINNNNGSTLIFTVIVIFLMTILITGMLGMSVANFKFISESSNLNNSYYNSNTIGEAILFIMFNNAKTYLEGVDNFKVNTAKKEIGKEMLDLKVEELNDDGTINDLSNLSNSDKEIIKNEYETILDNYPYNEYDKEEYLKSITSFDINNDLKPHLNNNNIEVDLNEVNISVSYDKDLSEVYITIDSTSLYNSRSLDIVLYVNQILDYDIDNIIGDISTDYIVPASGIDLASLYNKVNNGGDSLTTEEKIYIISISEDKDVIDLQEHDTDVNLFTIRSWKIVD